MVGARQPLGRRHRRHDHRAGRWNAGELRQQQRRQRQRRCARAVHALRCDAVLRQWRSAQDRLRQIGLQCAGGAERASPAAAPTIESMDAPARHLRLLTETIEAVNSTLDLQEVLGLVARKVAEALEADACFVYLYDERADELVLRATHGTRVEEMTRRPKMRPGDGITGSAAAERSPIMIAAEAHLDPRFKGFSNLPEDEYESILAVPILAREKLAGALNVRTREPREFTDGEVDLLLAIAAQVAQTIVHAQLYAEA